MHAFFLGASVLLVLLLIGCLACIRPVKDFIETTMESTLPLSEPIILCGSIFFYGTLSRYSMLVWPNSPDFRGHDAFCRCNHISSGFKNSFITL